MRKLAGATLAVLLGAAVSEAGSPHFVGSPVFTVSGSTVCVTGKEAGLGNETQIQVELSFDAACVNRGSNKPQAENKESFAAAGTFPVQNGKANFALCAEATFQPSCVPPMSVEVSNLEVCDVGNGICAP